MSAKNQNNKPDDSGGPKFQSYWIYAIMSVVLLALVLTNWGTGTSSKIDLDRLNSMIKDDAVASITLVNGERAEIYLKDDKKSLEQYQDASPESMGGSRYDYYLEVTDASTFTNFVDRAYDEAGVAFGDRVRVNSEKQADYIGTALQWLLPLAVIAFIWIILMRRLGSGGGGPGGQIFNIGKSKATLFDQNSKVNITFADVAGLDEAKEEVMEVVDFLKNPKKYTALGGKIPKGVLLVGPPGTGKTLLAKAVAGEAGVPFFTMSGSDFVEMFVGVGASRVRDLFKQAREKAPCIIFIDEIDAIGRARGRANMQGGNDERENTLNQLLVEMDGFSTDKGVILMAATNRPDVLDSALLRPGRFDRQIGIDRPDLQGREAIFKVHLKTIKVNDTVTAPVLAEMTPGFAGAEIANICNEAALIAARRNQDSIGLDDFNYALDKVIGGLEKKNKLINPEEKKIIAYHEAGHAICGWFLEHAMPLVKVTIVPRGVAALGYAQYLPKEQYITRTEQMLDMMCMTFGGRAAEEVVFNKISTGAQNDLDKVTKMAYDMVTVYGMNKDVGQVSFYGMSRDTYQRPYSDDTATLIDDQVRALLDSQYQRAKQLLMAKREQVGLLAEALLEKEVLSRKDLEEMIGPRPADAEEGFQEWAGVVDNSHDPNNNGKVMP
ncbi:ATP-dependent zinc metalloprotease FtsH [Lewinella sp. IMCC34183]|uniref:ATP-dependent zinc metalloprotease FtsH n=1 Tax=Lewinella sp. IMCC34183 TaxID=2248762 RepID=UPI000E252965|nr:ATP-dependent zinc metalloprotease FtsH [Lewinella sp. IMCC34183]